VAATLDGSWAKFRRCRAQLKALNDEIAGFIEENKPVRFEGKFDPQTGIGTSRAHVDVHPDWIDWGLQVGDAIQNARASLDHAVWQLVILSGKDPRKVRTQFPICSSGVTYWSKTKDGRPSTRDRDLAGVAERYRTLIDAAQPYRAGHSHKDHALSGLAYLSNVDKHQVIHAGFFMIGDPNEYVFDGDIAGDVDEMIECDVHTGPFQEDTDIVTLRYRITGPKAHVNMKVEVPIEIAFSERGYSIRNVGGIFDAVEEVLSRIGEDF
jgi:hypothetical protein